MPLAPSPFDAVSPTSSPTSNPASVHPSDGASLRQQRAVLASDTRWAVLLGCVIAGVFVSYVIMLETACANTDPNQGAAELVITQGGSARFPAPLFVDASAELIANGTEDAELLWVENLCDKVLDRSTCPLKLNTHFNGSMLRGKILLYDVNACEELYMCGYNRLGRSFGHTGLVGLGMARLDVARVSVPGNHPKGHRLGEHRHAKPRGGDNGIPFVHFHVKQYAFLHILRSTGLAEGGVAEARAVLLPTAQNPWRKMACGYWKPLSTLLMLGHVGVVERAVSNWIGHVRTSGLRLDLAQLALATEILAHLCLAVAHHDPFLAFHWAALPHGAFASFICGSIILTCSSTLLLASYWYVATGRATVHGLLCDG